MQKHLHRSVFLTFLRMSTHKESKVSLWSRDRSPPATRHLCAGLSTPGKEGSGSYQVSPFFPLDLCSHHWGQNLGHLPSPLIHQPVCITPKAFINGSRGPFARWCVTVPFLLRHRVKTLIWLLKRT
jgi:hypothetical protein